MQEIKFISVIFFSLLLCQAAYNQNDNDKEIKDEIFKINKYYSNIPSLNLSMKYDLYKSHDTRAIHSSENGVFIRTNDNSYLKISNMETISDKKTTVMVSNTEKIIVVSNNNNSAHVHVLNDTLLNTIVGLCIKTELTKDCSPGKNCLYFEYAPGTFGEYSSVKIIYDSSTYKIEKLIFYLTSGNHLGKEWEGTKPRLEVTYTYLADRPVLNQEKYKPGFYYRIVKNELCTSPKFKDYEIFDQRIKY